MIKLKIDNAKQLLYMIQFIQYNDLKNNFNLYSVVYKDILKHLLFQLEKKQFSGAQKFSLNLKIYEAIALFQLYEDNNIDCTPEGVFIIKQMGFIHKNLIQKNLLINQ